MERDAASPRELLDAWQDALLAAELAERVARTALEATQASNPVRRQAKDLATIAVKVADASSRAARHARMGADAGARKKRRKAS